MGILGHGDAEIRKVVDERAGELLRRHDDAPVLLLFADQGPSPLHTLFGGHEVFFRPYCLALGSRLLALAPQKKWSPLRPAGSPLLLQRSEVVVRRIKRLSSGWLSAWLVLGPMGERRFNFDSSFLPEAESMVELLARRDE